MSYIKEKILTGKEKQVIEIQKSKFYLVLAWIWGIMGSFLIFIPTIMAIKKTMLYNNTEYVVTDSKAIEKYGVFNIHVDELAFSKIENITVNCPFWGSKFNYGNICIQGANLNNINFNNVKNPYEVKRQLSALIEKSTLNNN